MSAATTTTNSAPALDETLQPITIGTRAATAQETKAINALAAVLDDQPGPPRTLFDYGALMPAELRLPRPAAARARARVPAQYNMGQPTPRTAQPAAEPRMIEAKIMADAFHADDYTPTFVAPDFEVTALDSVVSTRDEAIAVAREVQARVDAAVEKATAEVMADDSLPFGKATLRLFCS